MASITAIAVGSSANDGTGDPIRTAFQSVNTNFSNLNAAMGYCMVANCSKYSPADGTTYYWGSTFDQAPVTTADIRRLYIPVTGAITKCYFYTYTNGTNSSESVTVHIRKNNTTDTQVSASVLFTNDSEVIAVTNLNIAVTAGDYIEFKVVVPTLTTNPTNVYHTAVLWISTT